LQSNEVGRIVYTVKPNYGINQNLKWTSLDSSIASVDESGRITGHMEGKTTILLSTLDGKFTKEASITVDNTIQLSNYDGEGYVGGNNLTVDIKSIDYNGISCNVSNSKVADCEINDKKLILKPKMEGDTDVVVKSDKYGEVVYKLKVQSVYFNIMPTYLCTTPNNVNFITVSGFNIGEMSFVSDDVEIIKSAYMELYQNRKMLRINAGSKQGRTTLRVTEGNGNSAALVVVDVTYIKTAEIGKVAKVGEEVSTTIISGNIGNLTCKVNNEEYGTCRIEGDKVIVTPLKRGSVTVDIYNNFSYESYNRVCGQAQFLVVIQE